MADWIEEYTQVDDTNRKYEILREAAAGLRDRRGDVEYYDPEAVRDDVRRLNEEIRGELIVFAANDFGKPMAFRPSDLDSDVQNEVREAILQNKYDGSNQDLNDAREELLAEHPEIHKAIVVEYADGNARYHLPEGSTEETNFLTVREMVGLVDYTSNSFQSEELSVTY